jgi:alkanesulfonate monooxygenase SsuD/methylene tetrahydromethanopterin reductase-like flavin-dependent oxidoreductase (luciferase family)
VDQPQLRVPVREHLAATDTAAAPAVYAPARVVRRWLDGYRQAAAELGYSPPGYISLSSLRGVLMAGMKRFYQLSYVDLLADGQALVGSPDTVARRLHELYSELGGFGQLIGLFAIGPTTHEQVTRSAELFASEVIPVLRPLGVAASA